MAKKDISYEEAIGELEIILEKIESNELEIDLLSSHVKRATELLDLCKNKLSKTEQEVEKILTKLED